MPGSGGAGGRQRRHGYRQGYAPQHPHDVASSPDGPTCEQIPRSLPHGRSPGVAPNPRCGVGPILLLPPVRDDELVLERRIWTSRARLLRVSDAGCPRASSPRRSERIRRPYWSACDTDSGHTVRTGCSEARGREERIVERKSTVMNEENFSAAIRKAGGTVPFGRSGSRSESSGLSQDRHTRSCCSVAVKRHGPVQVSTGRREVSG